MTLNDVALLAKDFVREATGDTITTSKVETFCTQAYQDWCEELQWPVTIFAINTAASVQEYNLDPSINVIFRVYVNGNRIPSTTIPLLEGDVQGNYDAQWTVLPAMEVPALSTGSGLAIPITAGPGFAKMQYYIRETITAGTNVGLIGLTPKPAAIYPMKIEAATVPQSVLSATILVFPNQYSDGLAWGGVYRFLMSDRRIDEAQGAKALEQESMQKAMRWRRRMGGYDQLPAIQPQDYRGFYNWRTRNRITHR